MQNIVSHYLQNLIKRYSLGNSTEHTFRGDFVDLIEKLMPEISCTNEPKRQACGAPDFILTKNEIAIGYIEAKNIGDKDLLGANVNYEQFKRYKISLDNLIFTDYLNFYFYQNGQLTTQIAIAEVVSNKIKPLPQNFTNFISLIINFCQQTPQSINNSQDLAIKMAIKARLLANTIDKALNIDESTNQGTVLWEYWQAFRQNLIKDITINEFSDIYAQTIVYGMFAARLNDKSLNDFSRQEAADLIPKTNPFLYKLFGYIAGPDLDTRIDYIINGLVEIFKATNLFAIFENFGKNTQSQDPIIHFYEDFLLQYNPDLRKSRGVFYTPKPVVGFIVKAVDQVLQSEFGLKQGLSDTSKIKVKIEQNSNSQENSKTKTSKPAKPSQEKIEQNLWQEIHRVQILDPATGTGTFLAEVILQIHQKFINQQGIWSSYVDEHLIPRLNGFEILMASYAMAHLQLDFLLTKTGYKPSSNPISREERFRVYLTNSLEEHFTDNPQMLLASWLKNEAEEANKIKRQTPVMVVLGNPPYSGESQNKGKWIMNLMEDYKKEPQTSQKLNEKNPKWLNDDYVKFIRFGQHFVEKNGEGIIAFINPHGFLDNPTFRGMRYNLLKTFDKIYTLDLHGNSKKKETAEDGGKDENVFNIQQGVAINIFIKTGKKPAEALGQVFHFDLFGKRQDKYRFLAENSLNSISFQALPNVAPNYFFVPKNFDLQKDYDCGFSLNQLFVVNSVGVVTAKDEILINDSKAKLLQNVAQHYQIEPDSKLVQEIAYRPFDQKFIYYDPKLVERARQKVMQHFLLGENLGLVINKPAQGGANYFSDIYLTVNITDQSIFSAMKRSPFICPLYIYDSQSSSSKNAEDLFIAKKLKPRTPNLKAEIVEQIAQNLGLKFVPDHQINLNSSAHNSGAYNSGAHNSGACNSGAHNSASYNSPLEGESNQLAGLVGGQNISSQENHSLQESNNLTSANKNTFNPLDLLDYIYAILHCPTYRLKYQEFLKIDFPKVPYPQDKKQFWRLVNLGGRLREVHLLTSPKLDNLTTGYEVSGDNLVEQVRFEGGRDSGKVFINQNQYFSGISKEIWEFYIGGYQPAQKWLKDRKGQKLTFDQVLHYQKIIAALSTTIQTMAEIELAL